MADTLKSEVILTDKIRKCIRSVLTKESLPEETREELRHYSSNRVNREAKKPRTIPFELVKKVHHYLVQSRPGQEGIYLHELLDGSDVHFPEHEEPPRNPELEQRIQRLKAEQSNREYRAMTRNVGNRKTQENNDFKEFGKEVKEINKQLIAMVNFILTVGGAFVFGYKMWDYTAESSPPVSVKLCSGLILGTIVFFADLYFLVKHTS